jgi:hypothetical protein
VNRSGTVRDVKNSLREFIGCESDWAPQQLHYTIALYTNAYQELTDDTVINDLLVSGRLFSGDDMYLILTVNSGRALDYFDVIGRYLRKICVGLGFRHRGQPLAREDPNHNYLFYWVDNSKHGSG